MADIPAITLHRPWSTLVARGTKDVENRNWYTNHRGPVWIHAGKAWDRVAVPFAKTRGVEVSPRPEDHPTGIVALARISWVCRGHLEIDRVCTCTSPWAVPGEHHWHLADVKPLATPVTCNGQQGFWWPNSDVVAQLAPQMEAVNA